MKRFLKANARRNGLCVAVSENTRAQALSLAEKDARVIVCTGGAARGASVLNALRTLQKHGVEAGIAAIHDAARCLVPPAVIDAGRVRRSGSTGAALQAIPMRDTVRDAKGTLLPRETLFLMQTPQAFDFARILAAVSRRQRPAAFRQRTIVRCTQRQAMRCILRKEAF